MPVPLRFPEFFYDNTCFRAAALALTAGDLRCGPHSLSDVYPLARRHDENTWKYYEEAVKDLHARLQRPGEKAFEQLAAAALLLAYHEMASGTPLGVRNHASGLNAIGSSIDFRVSSMPSFLKAWWMIRYETRFFALATRKSSIMVDTYDACGLLDPQLEIRDIYSRAWVLYSRFYLEATFRQNFECDGTGASEKAACWIQSILGRPCDLNTCRHKIFTAITSRRSL